MPFLCLQNACSPSEGLQGFILFQCTTLTFFKTRWDFFFSSKPYRKMWCVQRGVFMLLPAPPPQHLIFIDSLQVPGKWFMVCERYCMCKFDFRYSRVRWEVLAGRMEEYGLRMYKNMLKNKKGGQTVTLVARFSCTNLTAFNSLHFSHSQLSSQRKLLSYVCIDITI